MRWHIIFPMTRKFQQRNIEEWDERLEQKLNQ